MPEPISMPFYPAIKEHIHNAKEPFTVIHTKLSLENNLGGERNILQNQLEGPIKKNMNKRYMLGLTNVETDEIRHIYLHTITEIITAKGEHILLKL